MPAYDRTAGRPPAAGSPRWAEWDDGALLNLRFRDLRLSIRTSAVQDDITRLYTELERRGIRFRPHVWLAESWFSPDGVPGFAVPFFAAHPRLRRLEERIIGEAEGGRGRWRMQLLRHEAGHAIDTAYGLRRRADWRRTFGRASEPYPRAYSAQPASRKHVLHLPHWYAQSHPTEDFAETFAVWLGPKARWRRDYAGWPALAKLEYVDQLMREAVIGRPPRNRDRSTVAPLAGNGRTLAAHYRSKQAHYAGSDTRYDAWLEQVFRPRAAARSAGSLRTLAPTLRRRLVASGVHPYVVDHVLKTVAGRVAQLGLALSGTGERAERLLLQLHSRIIEDMLRRNRERFVR